MPAPSEAARALALLLVLAAACTQSEFEFAACTEDVHCRDSLGFGAVCGARGLCEQVTPTPRCARSYPEDLWQRPGRYRQSIVLASLMDRSSEAHQIRENAIRLAVKGANAAGGLEGRSFALVMCDIRQNAALDELGRTDAAVASTQFLAGRLGVPAIIGPSASVDVERVWEVARKAGTLVISPAATSPALAELEGDSSDADPGLLWRMAPTDALQGRVIADDMTTRGVKRVLVVRETGAYGEGLARVFTDRFRQAGGSFELASIRSEAEAREAAAMLAPDAPAEVLFVSSQQAWIVAFLNAAGTAGSFAERHVFLTDAAANQSVLNLAADSAAGLFPRVRGTRPAPRDPSDYELASFIAEYRTEYAGADPTGATFSAHAFDAAWLTLYGAAHALLQEKRVSGAGIARGLRRLGAGFERPIVQGSWPLVVSAFRAGESVNVRGASGDLDYHPTRRDLSAPIQIWAVGDMAGSFTMVGIDTRTPQD